VTIVDERPVRSEEVERDPPPPSLQPDLRRALRREIERAIEPVLADFREQSVRTVRQQGDQANRAEPPEPEPGLEGSRSSAPPSDSDAEPTDGAPKQADQEHSTAPIRPEPSELSKPVLQAAEQLGTQWIKSRVDDGRAALCSARVRDGIRESIERTFFPLLEAGLELVPSDGARRALQEESERSLDEFVTDALQQFCSEHILADLQRHAEAAFLALVRLDIATMVREIWEAVRALFRALLAAAQDQWHSLLHLILHVLLKATQEMVGTIVKDGLAAIVAVPVEEIEEKAETAKETIEDRLTEVRDRLAERIEALQGRVREEVEQVKERVADGIKSAVDGGTRSDKFGRPPTGRPPSLQSPSGRPPSGRPPSGRPPTGRPPSLTRRHT
jgi:hypothetical protein